MEIHETAFVTSTLRSLDENLSQDEYAKLWRNSKTEKWVAEYLAQVSNEETYTHCLRNKYFLDSLRTLIADQGIEVLINFGSGFSMYPFLLSDKLINIEIDKPEIVAYKKKQISIWEKENKLPIRNIHFIVVDFSQDYQANLLSKILSIKQHKPCIILIEGVLFFLKRSETDQHFSLFATIQNRGDYIGSASFPESLRDTLALKKLMDFVVK